MAATQLISLACSFALLCVVRSQIPPAAQGDAAQGDAVQASNATLATPGASQMLQALNRPVENDCKCHCIAAPPSPFAMAATGRLQRGVFTTHSNLGTLQQRLEAIEDATESSMDAIRDQLAMYYGRSLMEGQTTPTDLPAAALLANAHRMLEEMTGRAAAGGQLHTPGQYQSLQGVQSAGNPAGAGPTGGVAQPIPASTPVILGQNAGALNRGAQQANPGPNPNVPIDFVAAAQASLRRQQQQAPQ